MFGNSYIRNKFIFTILNLLFLLLVIRFFVFPIETLVDEANEIFTSFIDKFVASVFTAVLVGYFLYTMQVEEKKREIEFTDSSYEIEKHLRNARATTEKWCFNGGLGRYTKFSTIPELSRLASDERRTISVNLVMINPFNRKLMEKYIEFRISVEDENNKKSWVELEVQSEILTTIVTAFYYKKINQFLNISLYIKDFFTLTRMDISSSVAVITREDPSIPSIIAKKGSYMFRHYSEEFEQVLRQSNALNYKFPGLESPNRTEIAECLNALFPTEKISTDIIDAVFKKFSSPKNPF